MKQLLEKLPLLPNRAKDSLQSFFLSFCCLYKNSCTIWSFNIVLWIRTNHTPYSFGLDIRYVTYVSCTLQHLKMGELCGHKQSQWVEIAIAGSSGTTTLVKTSLVACEVNMLCLMLPLDWPSDYPVLLSFLGLPRLILGVHLDLLDHTGFFNALCDACCAEHQNNRW